MVQGVDLPPVPCHNRFIPSNPPHENRSPLPDPLRQSAVALPVVPHPARSRADGDLLPLLWVTLPHRPQQSGTVCPPQLVAQGGLGSPP
jgi:hypothetical protein